MKIKNHHICKIILSIVFAFTFSYCFLVIKQIPEYKLNNKMANTINPNIFDKMDIWMETKSEQFFYLVKESSDFNIIFYSTLFSILMVLFVDLIAGVGRSRFN